MNQSSQINTNTIQSSVDFILKFYKIKTKEQLDKWCGGKGRKKMYLIIKILAPDHWSKLGAPDAAVRAHYETKLKGYKIFKT
tara:strand:- start:138 stop:383 length:246 start_codon:yes stop_codon:yes gene_type:complete